MPLKILLVFLFTGFMAFGLLSAEEPEPPAFLSIRILMFNEGGPENVYVIGRDEIIAIRLSTVQPSRPVLARNAHPLPIFDQRPTEGATEVPHPFSEVSIPSGHQNLLLFGAVHNERIRWAAVPDTLKRSSSRDWQIINTTESPIFLRIGEESAPLILQPGSQNQYRITMKSGQGAAVIAARMVENEPKIFFSTYWPVKDEQRGLILFLKNGDNIKVKRIVENLPQF